ncbi:hypothetical protein GBF38_008086, partial [Nibea albiflora]
VNQCGVIRQPLAMVCPAPVDLKPDGYHQQTRSCITLKRLKRRTEKQISSGHIMCDHGVTWRKRRSHFLLDRLSCVVPFVSEIM